MDTANPVEEQKQDANANPADDFNNGTQETETPNPIDEAVQPIDYKQKFSASSAEALRLLEENKAKDAEIERLRLLAEAQDSGESSESLYAGFEDLDPEAQENLLNYTRAVEEKVKKGIYADPAISHARQVYAEKKFDDAFSAVAQKFPELNDSKDEFKSKYFQPNNTPDNIETILADVAKVHLFDRQRELGAEEEREKANRIDTERAKGGPQAKPTSRTLEEWSRIAQNPAEFAKLSKEYQADLESGKLGE